MKWRTTWMLVALAAALFAFIVLVEPRLRPSYDLAQPPPRLLAFKAAEVTNVQLRITNQLILHAERTPEGDAWSLTVPFYYPAQSPAIDWLLRSLEELAPPTFIPQSELTAGKRTLADYGLDLPPATLTLVQGGKRTELQFGAKTPTGDQVYLQLLDRPGVYLVPAELYDRLPRTFHDWRDSMLFSTVSINRRSISWNRIDVRAASRSYTVELINGAYLITRPTIARADPAKIGRLLQAVGQAQITQFVTDHPRADLELYGLQPPEMEVAFGSGTNDLIVIQFGRSPTNDSSLIYARRMAQTNVVLTSHEIFDAFQISFNELRDLHMISLPPSGLSSIEVIGTEHFSVQRQTNGMWSIVTNGETAAVAADLTVLRDWVNDLAKLEGTVEKDVVTDFKTLYNLDPPARQYILRTSLTNASGATTNVIVGAIHLGTRQDTKVFARRPDEATVYSVSPKDVARLPSAAWQLRDRRVWSFTTNQIGRVTVRFAGESKTVQRNPNGSWSYAEGSQGIIGDYGPLDEMMFRLGELRASAWVAQGAERKALFGIQDTGIQFTVELKNGDKPRVMILEFGGDKTKPSPSGLPYAMSTADGQSFIFEFPPALYFELLRNLVSPLFPANAKP